MTIGQRIKELRLNNNKTQLDISKILGVNFQTVYKYEKDIVVPPAETLSKLAEYFNVTVDYLLGRTDISNNINKKIEDNNIRTAASSSIDLAKYAQLDPQKKEFIDKQMNEMIDIFLKEKKE